MIVHHYIISMNHSNLHINICRDTAKPGLWTGLVTTVTSFLSDVS